MYHQRKSWIPSALKFVLLLPILAITVLLFFNINAFIVPEFWYAYMSYFGTVLLASLALWQSQKASNEKTIRFVDLHAVKDKSELKNKDWLSIDINNSCVKIENDEIVSATAPYQIYLLKNIGQEDILCIEPVGISVITVFEKEKRILYTHEYSYNFGGERINSGETIPLVIVGLEIIGFPKQDADIAIEGSRNSLQEIQLELSITNYIGQNYIQIIKFSAATLSSDYTIYPKVINKRFSIKKNTYLR